MYLCKYVPTEYGPTVKSKVDFIRNLENQDPKIQSQSQELIWLFIQNKARCLLTFKKGYLFAQSVLISLFTIQI